MFYILYLLFAEMFLKRLFERSLLKKATNTTKESER